MDGPSSEINKRMVKDLAPSLNLVGTGVEEKTDCLRGFHSSLHGFSTQDVSFLSNLRARLSHHSIDAPIR